MQKPEDHCSCNNEGLMNLHNLLDLQHHLQTASTAKHNLQAADLQHHLQAASRAFHANRSVLTNHQVSVKDRLTFFHAVVTPVACFAAGHRTIFKQELAAIDVAHRKLLRQVVGPPAGMDWSRPWHEILHDWNVRASTFVGQAGLKPWSQTCLEQYWKLAHYTVNLPCDR